MVSWLPPLENGDKVSKFQMKLEFVSRDMPTESGWALHNFTDGQVHGRKYKLTTLRPYADYKLSIREGTGEQPIWETSDISNT